MPKLPQEFEQAAAWEDMPEEEREAAEEEQARIVREAEPQVLSEAMPEEERAQELLKYLTAAREKHIKVSEAPVPGFVNLEIDVPIPIYTADKPVRLEVGGYLVDPSEDLNEACVYVATLDQNTLDAFFTDLESGKLKQHETDGGVVEYTGEEQSLQLEISRVEISPGEPLLYLALLTFLAMKEAEEAGDEEKFMRIFSLGFKPQREEKEEPLEEMASLVKQHTIKPRKQIDPNSKLANKITNPALYGEAGALLDVSGKNEKGRVETAVSLSYQGEGVSIAKQLTQFDREVHNAVTTLFVAGNKNVTIAQIWRQLSGSGDKPNEAQAGRIRESVDKQRFTRVVIDYTAEARGRELKDMEGNPITSFVIDDYMINATRARIETANGREVEGYVVNRPPALFEYSNALGQVVSYPARLLDTSAAGQNTLENIVIKKYLLRRIGQLKGKSSGKLSPRIKYESVYRVAGYEGEGSPDKKQRKRINDYVLGCLELWKGEGEITAFQEYKEGRRRAGVEIST